MQYKNIYVTVQYLYIIYLSIMYTDTPFDVSLLGKYIAALLHQRPEREPHTVHEGELIF
jgi:hypothetical protein